MWSDISIGGYLMTDEREDGQTELEEFSSPTGVVIGEQDTEVSFQILQSVYNELTGEEKKFPDVMKYQFVRQWKI